MNRVCPDTGTYSNEYKWRCLARHVCRIIGRPARKHWLDRFARHHGLTAMLKLKQAVEKEWPTRNEVMEPGIVLYVDEVT